MRVVDDSKRNAFQILHPRKSFLTICPNQETKKTWIEAILSEIDKSEDRKIMAEEIRHAYDADLSIESATVGTSSSRESEGLAWTELRNGVVVGENGLGSVKARADSAAMSAKGSDSRGGGLRGLDIKLLNERFHRALHFSTDLLSGMGSSKTAGEDVKLKLYGFFKQAKEGNATAKGEGELGEVEQMKLDAWKSYKGMTRMEAKSNYIDLLTTVSPHWDTGT